MKRIFILFLVAIIASTVVFAEEATLINFNELIPDYPADNPVENAATLIDYGKTAGASFTDEDKAKLKTSLAIKNWHVVLNSSARSVKNQSLSYTAEAPVSEAAVRYADQTTLGVRIHFPVEPFNAWALIKPPFEIPAYSDIKTVNADGTLTVDPENKAQGKQFENKGVIKNIAIIKSISVNVYGQNIPHKFSIILKNHENVETEYLLGNLNFDGWKTLEWNNSSYIKDIRNRELKTWPLYPSIKPMQKLVGFRIYRHAAHQGGDSIAYIKDVSVIYDKAILDTNRDIDDENIWGILQKRAQSRSNAEDARMDNLQLLRYLENQKIDNPDTRENADTQENNQQ